MTAPTRTPSDLTAIVDRLRTGYAPHGATAGDVIRCVSAAWDAVRFLGADGESEVTRLAERVAERDLRLRLGLDREAARLDPEKHER